MTEPHAGADPTLFTTRAVQGRRRVGDQRLEVLLVERQDGVVPHRDGRHQPRRQPVQGHVDVPGARPTRPGVNIVRNVGLYGEPVNEGFHALIHYEDVRVPEEALLGGEGQAFVIAQTRLGGGRIHHAMRTIGMAQKAIDMMCERALSRETAGQPAGRQAVRAGLHRRLLRPADAVPPVRALHGLGDRQVQRLQAGAQGHRHGQGGHAHGAARHRLAGHAGARRAGHDQRDALLRDDPRRRRHGPGRRADRGAQGHRGPPGAARLQGQRRHVAHAVAAQAAGGRQGEVRPVPRARGGNL